jgi:hypothetical protein
MSVHAANRAAAIAPAYSWTQAMQEAENPCRFTGLDQENRTDTNFRHTEWPTRTGPIDHSLSDRLDRVLAEGAGEKITREKNA